MDIFDIESKEGTTKGGGIMELGNAWSITVNHYGLYCKVIVNKKKNNVHGNFNINIL